jgi:DEAD/DEAH box helicase domain-containing protein
MFFGDVVVTWQTVGFKKIKYYTLEVVGQTALDLPSQSIETQALWVQPPAECLEELRLAGYKPVEALVGVRNMMLAALPFLAMADRHDISGVVGTSQTGALTMFVYDRYPGGVGYARAGYDRLDELMAMCRTIVKDCDCQSGCPSCVGLPNLRPPLHGDPDLGAGYAIPDKAAATALLDQWLSDSPTGPHTVP